MAKTFIISSHQLKIIKFLWGNIFSKNISLINSSLLAEIRFAISSIKNRSYHISTYPPKCIKFLEPLIFLLLAIIVNESLNTGIFPKSIKLDKCIPIHKAEDTQNLSNYRPISIPPLRSNFFKIIVFKQMLNYLDNFLLLSNNHFWF